VFACIEIFALIGQIYSVFAFFRWTRSNTEASRSGIPSSNLVQAACNTVVCALCYAFFTKQAHIEEDVKWVMHNWYGLVAWSLVCFNLIFYHYTNEYRTNNLNIEDDDEMLEKRITTMIESMWSKYDDDNNDVLDRGECRKFVKAVLRPGEEINQDRFDDLFKEMDRDESNTIDKTEMFDFIMKLYTDEGADEEALEGAEQ
jgi:hypothetical protein